MKTGGKARIEHQQNHKQKILQDEKNRILSIDLCRYDGILRKNGQAYNDLKSSFNMIYEAMDGVFDAIIDDHKALSIVQISLTDENDLQVISLWKYSQFTFGGDWRWGLKAGKCDGTYQGRDATNAIAWFYNVNFANPQPYGIWTNVAFSQVYSGGDPLLYEPGNPFGNDNSLLFYNIQWDNLPYHCMLQTHNYYYASKIPEAIERIVSNESITKPVMGIIYTYDQMNAGNPHPIMHSIAVLYGDYSSTIHAPYSDFFSE